MISTIIENPPHQSLPLLPKYDSLYFFQGPHFDENENSLSLRMTLASEELNISLLGENNNNMDLDENFNDFSGIQENKNEDTSIFKTDNPPEENLELQTGQVFDNRDLAIEFVRKYSCYTQAAFTIRKSYSKPGKPLLFECKHGRKRGSESTGQRPNQSTVKLGCPAFIRFYVRANGVTVLTNFNGQHGNHTISDSVYERDIAKADPASKEIIKEMCEAKVKLCHIKNALYNKGYNLTTDQIRYQASLFCFTILILNKSIVTVLVGMSMLI